MSPPLAPGIHLTMAAGFANFTFLTIEEPITRVCSSAGVSLSGENVLETWLVVSRGLQWFAATLPQTVTHSPWLPGCSGSTGGRLTKATSGRPAQTTGDGVVRYRASKSLILTSSAVNKLHLIQVPLSLKEVEE